MRIEMSPVGADSINILGIDVYDDNRVVILDHQSCGVYGNIHQFGPHYLIDGIHQEYRGYWWEGWRMPHTDNVRGNYMELDFGQDMLISTIVHWNRAIEATERILGCTLSIINNSGFTV